MPKSSGQVRICIDFTKLNMSVKRENFPLPSVEESLSKLANAVVFSKLDANSSFWQTNLATESRPLTTFISMVRDMPTMVVTGNGESGFDSGEGA